MVVKIYISRTTGNKEMQKKQDHILWTLESKSIEHLQIDIGDPLLAKERQFMRENIKTQNNQMVLPPQIFNDEEYIGDYNSFFEAVECEQLYDYLHIEIPNTEVEYIIKLASTGARDCGMHAELH
jgi:SH3 domain-binding glutamic acid-rich protein